MKINSLILTTLIAITSCSNDDTYQESVLIPDSEFEQLLIEQEIDSDNTLNGELLKSDAEKVNILDLNKDHSFGSIQDLSGIEAFSNITYLSAAMQEITSIDLSANTKLKTLLLQGNHIKEISFDKNPNLTLIDVQANELEEIRGLFYAKNLKKLNASYNNLEFLNVTNSSIEILHVSHNLLKGLTVTSAPNLKNILATSNKLSPYLNVTNNTKLETLLIGDNKLLEVNFEYNTELTHLYASSNQLNTLDVSNNEKLVDLQVDRNPNLTCIQKGIDQYIPYLSLSDYQTIGSNCD